MQGANRILRVSLVFSAFSTFGCADGEAILGPTESEFPPSLSPTGSGFPSDGDPCRVLIVNEAIAKWSGDFGTLVGCPTNQDAIELGGQLVGLVDGFSIVAPFVDGTDAVQSKEDGTNRSQT